MQPVKTNNVFNYIYKHKQWGDNNGTLSGSGSTREANVERNKFLINFITKNGIKYVYDICGDCNWQRDFMKQIPTVKYYGLDISQEAINRVITNSSERLSKNMEVIKNAIDLSREMCDVIDPENTLFIVKEVIQHLPLYKGMAMLKNIKNAGVKYLAITNHDKKIHKETTKNGVCNFGVQDGGFYPNNMFDSPYSFKNPLDDISNYIPVEKQKHFGNLIIFNIQEQKIGLDLQKQTNVSNNPIKKRFKMW